MESLQIKSISKDKAKRGFNLPNINSLQQTIQSASNTLLTWQNPEGHWWFSLEANETIGSGFIQLMHFLGSVEKNLENKLVQRILQEQNENGSWSLYYDGPGDLSTTVECYFALCLAGSSKEDSPLKKAKEFIRRNGGLLEVRIFTRIHLALFGLVPWSASPTMPVEMMLLPKWSPVNIYTFSSWARASIVPLLVLFAKKPVVPTDVNLEELYLEDPSDRKWKFEIKDKVSWDAFFVYLDKSLKTIERFPLKHPLRIQALDKATQWIWEHIQKTEDIYPALAYGAMAFKALGYSLDSPQMQKPLRALKGFQQHYDGELPNLPGRGALKDRDLRTSKVHQQCCVSPVWDTPWALTSLLETGISANHPALTKAGRWLLSKEIQNPNGDWKIKNPKGKAGGWAFEFQNEYFPDVDDTIQVLQVLDLLNIPSAEKEPAIARGLSWVLSMQNNDGGWAAFDKNNDLELVNRIPFSDHGACLDPSTPDITGRVLETLVRFRFDKSEKPVRQAVKYLLETQEDFGGWFGRWGVNYIYGTWAVLTGLHALQPGEFQEATRRAVAWLKSIQHQDGGFSESPESYQKKSYVSYPESIPSQTAWGVMGLIAAGQAKSESVAKGIEFLISRMNAHGTWNENHFTGTGFPGHFYIRYHGYRHYFPLLALARYRSTIK